MANIQTATLASGCFWCYEAIFKSLKGVESVVPGYSGGSVNNPSYEQVSYEETGHAESYQITFNAEQISFEQLLDVFFYVHDPTTLNRQGPDVGTQYRSAIFYHDDEQKQVAEESIKKHQADFDDPIVTEVSVFTKFYEAEDYHKNFYERNPENAYCRLNIAPKMAKFKEHFGELLKD